MNEKRRCMTKESDSRIMDKYIVDFYEKEDGEAPVEDFIRSLDAKMKAKIFRIVDMLEENGPTVRLPQMVLLRKRRRHRRERLPWQRNIGQTMKGDLEYEQI